MNRSFARRALVWLNFGLLLLLSACGGGDGSETAVSANPSTAPVASVRVTPENRQIGVRETAQFTAEALDANGAVLAGKTYTFASSSPSVATVGNPAANPATVTAVADGVTRITATAEGKTGTATLTVSGFADVQVSGRVIDGQTQQGLAGANVSLNNGVSTTSAADGSFSFAARTNAGEVAIIYLSVSRAEYVTTDFSGSVSAPAGTLPPIVLVRQGPPSTISGTVRNARDNTPIANAAVGLAFGQNELPGSGAGTTTSDAQGAYSFTNLAAGTYTVNGYAEGFANCSRTAISVGPPAVANQDLICSPANSNEIRVVLTWGIAPSDLDSHLTGPHADPSRFHVFYSSRGNATGAPFAVLDVDDTTSNGPETITLTKLNSGVYRYSVHDFTNRKTASSTALGTSGAKVELYLPRLVLPQTFFVPNQPGTLWTVFELSGDLNDPTITARNEMGLAEESGSIP